MTTFTVACSTSSPYLLILFAVYVYYSFKIQRYYMNLNRELTRLKAISSSPIIQKFKEGLEGVSTIRAFHQYNHIFGEYVSKVNDFQKNNIASEGASNWFSIRISLLALIVIIPTIGIAVSFIEKSF